MTLEEYLHDVQQRWQEMPARANLNSWAVAESAVLADRLLEEAAALPSPMQEVSPCARERYLRWMSAAWCDYRAGNDCFGAFAKVVFAVNEEEIAKSPAILYTVGSILKEWSCHGLVCPQEERAAGAEANTPATAERGETTP